MLRSVLLFRTDVSVPYSKGEAVEKLGTASQKKEKFRKTAGEAYVIGNTFFLFSGAFA